MLRADGVGEVGDTGGRPQFFVAAAGLMRRRFVVGFALGTLTEPTMTAARDGSVTDGGEPPARSRGGGGTGMRAPACGSPWGPSFPFSLGCSRSASEVPL
jgi:hypothetical protein